MNQRLQRMKRTDVSSGQYLSKIIQLTQAFQDMAKPNATVASSSSQTPETVSKVMKPPRAKTAETKAKAKALEAITMSESKTMAVERIRDDAEKQQERDEP